MKHYEGLKKLALNKETVSNLDILTREAQREIAAGNAYSDCWENLWTMYYCDVIWTGKEPEVQANVALGSAKN